MNKIQDTPTTTANIPERLATLPAPVCYICDEENDVDLVTFKCQCKTKLINPRSAEGALKCLEASDKSAHDLDKALQDIKIDTFNCRIICHSCCKDMNEKANDVVECDYHGLPSANPKFSTDRKCFGCRQYFSTRTLKKMEADFSDNKIKESIRITLAILKHIAAGPVITPRQELPKGELFQDLLKKDDKFRQEWLDRQLVEKLGTAGKV